MSPSSQNLCAFQPPLLNTNNLTCQLQNVSRIYWGAAERKSEWQGRDEGAKCSKGGADEHLQGSGLSWGHGPVAAVGHGEGWGTSTGVSIMSASECCPQSGYQESIENCKTHPPNGEETFLGLAPHPIFVLKNHARVVRTQQILSMTVISLWYPKF